MVALRKMLHDLRQDLMDIYSLSINPANYVLNTGLYLGCVTFHYSTGNYYCDISLYSFADILSIV